MSKAPYYGGTGITEEKLISKLETCYVSGTHYPVKTWLKECAVIESLTPGVSKVWIPYGGTEKHGTLKEIEWNKVQIKGYLKPDDEGQDWWYYEPILVVVAPDNGYEYFVYEYSAYFENFPLWRNLLNKWWYRWKWIRLTTTIMWHLKYKHLPQNKVKR